MNEKFKKDEVWGYLGKEKQKDETERVDDSGTGQSLDDKESCTKVGTWLFYTGWFGSPVEFLSLYLSFLVCFMQPAYNKDEFFDTISCNSLNRGGRNGHRFSERMKMDSEVRRFL